MTPGGLIVDDALRLEPLAEHHRAGLKAACAQDLAIWQIYATSYHPDQFDGNFDRLLSGDCAVYALVLDGEIVGKSGYFDIDTVRGVLEIGSTYYVPTLRGTGFNRRVKDLMIRHAIACGFRRIEFCVDARNTRSQAAMAKIGGVREGILRADRITWNGHVRDTVLFSILAEEWPAAEPSR